MPVLLSILKPVFDGIASLLLEYQRKTGMHPVSYYHALSRLVPMGAIELLVLRRHGASVEIFLIKRTADDPHWPLFWHHPGTVLRNADTFQKVWKRLANELGIQELPSIPKLQDFKISINAHGTNGHAYYVLWIDEGMELGTGKFFDLAQLPADMIDFQKEMLKDIDIFSKGA